MMPQYHNKHELDKSPFLPWIISCIKMFEMFLIPLTSITPQHTEACFLWMRKSHKWLRALPALSKFIIVQWRYFCLQWPQSANSLPFFSPPPHLLSSGNCLRALVSLLWRGESRGETMSHCWAPSLQPGWGGSIRLCSRAPTHPQDFPGGTPSASIRGRGTAGSDRKRG